MLGRQLTEIAPIAGLREMFEKVATGVPIKNALLEGAVATRPDEHRFWNVSYFPVLNADGSVRAITAASLEITAQRKAELALIQSEKLAAVGRLASSISHEINNPLEAVTNLFYIIANDPSLPGAVAPFVETAQSELTRGMRDREAGAALPSPGGAGDAGYGGGAGRRGVEPLPR